MAERRMFAKTIIDSDAFLDMPLSTQALYFHLSMRADDEGFINNPKKIQRIVNCSDDDLKLLIAKRFIIPFDSGIVVIKHWLIHNYIRKDRIQETVYQEEKSMLEIKDNGAYKIIDNSIEIECQPSDNQVTPKCQHRIGKDRIGKDSINIYAPVIEYLNQKCGTSYKSSSKKTKSLIDARANEGFTLEDFKKVIDIKSKEWLNTDMAKYLRPETLFGTKFESYLNQKPEKPKPPNKFHNSDNVIAEKIAETGEEALREKLKKKWGK